MALTTYCKMCEENPVDTVIRVRLDQSEWFGEPKMVAEEEWGWCRHCLQRLLGTPWVKEDLPLGATLSKKLGRLLDLQDAVRGALMEE